MKKVLIFLSVLQILLSISITSCSKKNPIGPAVRQTWGTYDYMSYGLYENWEYIKRYPSINDSVKVWYYIYGTEYMSPYKGWKRAIFIDGEFTGYYYLDAVISNAVYNANPYGRVWWLIYEIPFVVGNRWHTETIFLDFDDIEWRRTIDGEVVGREDVNTPLGFYEDCPVLSMQIRDCPVDTSNGNVDWHWVRKEWFAPYSGMVKWAIESTNIEDWKNASGVLTKRYHKRYTGSANNVNFTQAKRVSIGPEMQKKHYFDEEYNKNIMNVR